MKDLALQQLLEETGAILKGHFLLTSGRHSDTYFEKFRALERPEVLTRLCYKIAHEFKGEIDVVAGPTTGGIIVAFETARQLGCQALYVETEEGQKKLREITIFNRSAAAIGVLAFSVLLLLALGIVISVNVASLRSRIAWTQHTNDVLLQLASVQQSLVRMESNLRAYGLTADTRHIDAWPALTTETRMRLAKLGTLVADNPECTSRF